MTAEFGPEAAKARLLQLVRERAWRDGIDITLASGKKSTFYINGTQVATISTNLPAAGTPLGFGWIVDNKSTATAANELYSWTQVELYK